MHSHFEITFHMLTLGPWRKSSRDDFKYETTREMRGKFEAILYKVRDSVKWEVEKNSLSTATD